MVLSKYELAPAAGVFLPFLTSGFGSLITRKYIKGWYKNLNKPTWCPPNWVFSPVWAALYGTMGYSSYMVYRDGGGFNGPAKYPLMIYGTQLLLNSIWPFVFFKYKKIGCALVNLIALDVGIGATICKFSEINETAAFILYPYFGWCLFATALTNWIYRHNKIKGI